MEGPRLYSYKGCGTCREARKWLKEHAISFIEIPIRETPPSPRDLARLLQSYAGNRRVILNTSGADYRQPGMKERLAEMDDPEFLAFLSQRGNLIKCPVWLSSEIALAGFNAVTWEKSGILVR